MALNNGRPTARRGARPALLALLLAVAFFALAASLAGTAQARPLPPSPAGRALLLQKEMPIVLPGRSSSSSMSSPSS